MITFYPRDIELWRDTFKFTMPGIHGPSKVFYDRDDLLGFCKEHGVRLDDAKNPFEITGPTDHPVFGQGTFTVKQWTCIGWLKDDLL